MPKATTRPRSDDTKDALDDLHAAIDTLTMGAGRKEELPRPRGVPRFRVIVACTDGSPQSERALEWARYLAKQHGARVVVASVFAAPHLDVGVAAGYGFYPGYAAMFDDMRAALEKAATGGAESLREAGIDAESVVATGSPARQLADIATTHGADLVVMGSHHRLSIPDTIFGSTADALLDRVEASVLIARESPPARTILAATDGSHASLRAVAYALREASAAEADLIVEHVVEFPDAAAAMPKEGFLRDVIGRMDLATPPHVSYQLDAGRPADRIIAKARETEAELIVVGSRGLGRFRGWLTGSVSRRVAASAPTSVFVVKDAPDSP